MQAIILAAGRGTRMKELTDALPKSLLPLSGTTILEHKLSALPSRVDEIVLVVDYKHEMIEERFGHEYHGIPIRYVQQREANGTAGALFDAREYLHDSFLVLNGDDIYAKKDLDALIDTEGWAMLVLHSGDALGVAKVVVGEDGFIAEICESGEHMGGPGLLNTGAYKLDTRIFDVPMAPTKATKTGEFGLPQTLLSAHTIPIVAVRATTWFPVNTPEDLVAAEAAFAH